MQLNDYAANTKNIIPRHIADLIANGEGQTLDFKFEINDAKKLAKTLVAFANTDGGILLIGVKDNGKIAGIKSDEEMYMIESAARIFSKPAIPYEIKIWQIGKKNILEVIIPKSNLRPHYAKNDKNKWIAYIRNKDKTLMANKVLIDVWKNSKNPKPIKIIYSRKEQLLLNYLTDNKFITIKEFVNLAQISYKLAQKILVDFILLDIIGIQITEKEALYYLKNNSK